MLSLAPSRRIESVRTLSDGVLTNRKPDSHKQTNPSDRESGFGREPQPNGSRPQSDVYSGRSFTSRERQLPRSLLPYLSMIQTYMGEENSDTDPAKVIKSLPEGDGHFFRLGVVKIRIIP